MKLNIGCGPFHPAGWLNIDVEPGMEPDVVASVLDIPYAGNTVTHVYLGHVLEHLPFSLVPTALEEVRRVLIPGGLLCVVGPDVRRAWKGYKDGAFDEDVVHGVIMGEGCGGHATDVHLWTCEEAIVKSLVADEFIAIQTPGVTALDPMWPIASRVQWQFAITARKPSTEGAWQ